MDSGASAVPADLGVSGAREADAGPIDLLMAAGIILGWSGFGSGGVTGLKTAKPGWDWI